MPLLLNTQLLRAQKRIMMKSMLVLLVVMISAVLADPTPGQVTPVQFANLDPECAGDDREVLVITVDYQPGGADDAHRHDACVFVYVLEGEIEMKVSSSEIISRLKPGDTYYEGPNDIHEIGRNANKDKPAKFLVTMIKKKGVDPVLPPTW